MKKLKGVSVLTACMVFTIMALALVLATCEAEPQYDGARVTYQVGEGRGSAPLPQVVTPGTTIELPGQENMTHSTRKVLTGWRLIDGTVYNPYYRYVVNRDVEFIAVWEAVTGNFIVTFNANGGSGTIPNQQSVQAGYSFTLPSGYTITRNGYSFGGWNTNSGGAGINYTAGTTYTPVANITLYARWNGAGGGGGGGSVPPTPTPPGHTHVWGEWTETSAATCTEDGSARRVCTLDSSHTETRSIAALGHDWGPWEYITNTTDILPGGQNRPNQRRTCNICGETEERYYAPPAHVHTWGEWQLSAATGIPQMEFRVCTTCGATETRVAPGYGNGPVTGW